MVFIIFQLVYVMLAEDPDGLGAFSALATISSTISEVILQLLWKQLPSVKPLIFLLQNDLIQSCQNTSGVQELVSDPSTLLEH
jgi:hypothetical protein